MLDNMFYLKEHRLGGDSVLAICDQEVVGKTFEGGGLQITVSEGFYGSTPASPQQVLAKIRVAANVNLIGDRVVALAIEHELVDETSVKKIGGVSHAIIMVI